MYSYKRFLASRVKRLVASEIRELLKLTEGKDVISFAGGLPDPRVFPVEDLLEISRKVVGELGSQALQYSPTKGVTAFRRTLLDFLAGQGVKVTGQDDVIITTGSQESLYILGRILIDKGDTVIVEEPGYLAAFNVFKSYGARLVPIPVDEEGMRTDVLEERLKRLSGEGFRVKLVYSNPTCQNPSGTTLSRERRRHLLELASDYDLLVIEDDPYSHFTFEGERPAHLKSLDSEGRVVYTSTFSKILVPGLRLGWALGPREIIDYMELAKQSIDLHSSTLSQYIAMEAIRRGVVEEVIARARRIYKPKRDAMLEALDYFLEGLGTWTRPVGGFFIFLTVNANIDSKALLLEAIERGVAYVPGGPFFVERRGDNTMRLSYSLPGEDHIFEGIRRLALLLRETVPSIRQATMEGGG